MIALQTVVGDMIDRLSGGRLVHVLKLDVVAGKSARGRRQRRE